MREAHTPTNGPRVTKFASVVRRPKNVQEESRRRRPAASAHPQVREYSGICRAAAASTRLHDWRRGAGPGLQFSTATSPPHKSRARASLQREPYRSRLKPSPFAVLLAPSCSAAAQRRWPRTGAPTGTACSSGVSPTATAPTSRALSGLLLASPDPMLLPPFCACPRPVPKP